MTHKLDADDLFIHRVQQHCAEKRLNFFLIEPLWVEAFRQLLELGQVQARVLLNMHSEHHQPEDVYHRLVKLAWERGVQVIDPPEVALAAFDKARMHSRLAAAGLNVPYTVTVEREQVGHFTLSEDQRNALGSPFVIKPSLGYGRKGVLLEATGEADLARSLAQWDNPHYLMQRHIRPRQRNGDPAYFRVFYVFGTIWCCWWNCYTDRYRLISDESLAALNVPALPEIARRIAALTGMRFFSSEIAETEAGELVLIDYVNDQCHMLSQSADPAKGVPDALVLAVAHRLVEATGELIHRGQF